LRSKRNYLKAGISQSKNKKALKKVLIVCAHRLMRSPSQRFRFEQYLSFLEKNGYQFQMSALLNAKDDRLFYSRSGVLRKGWIYLKTLKKRTADWLRANKYDLIFIQREALMTGSTFFEKRFSRSKAKMIFDFDDSIWLQNVSAANKKLAFLKNAQKTSKIIGMSDLIFAGNRYLAGYAEQFNPNVVIIPTTIDTDQYKPPAEKKQGGPVCIGWSGSITTIQHFAIAIPVLKKIREKYGDRVSFKIIGDANYYCTELDTKGEAWKAATEVEDLAKIDIGIMPLHDDEWAKGKCGLKGLQYMAIGIPTLMSPVGVNSEIIQNGVNGYLPATEDEWIKQLSELIENADLRKRIGDRGRETVVKRYSVDAWKEKYLDTFNELLSPQPQLVKSTVK
jgi:glycosyltransferase involved in cell wall biosynthesis